MAFNVKIIFEDDTTFEMVYRLQHVIKHFNLIKSRDPSITHIKTMPITPWLIAMAFEDVSDRKPASIKCIKITERVVT